MPDRFEEVKARYSEGWPTSQRRLADIGWLIGEVEALRSERASYITDAAKVVTEMRNQAATEVVVLRAALQALVDATAPHRFPYEIAMGRAVAVELLSDTNL